jgi:hypothetical protein
MIQRKPDRDGSKDIESLANEVVEDGSQWLDSPHPMLGGESPREAIRQQPSNEKMVRAILEGIKHGFSP